MTQSFKRYLSAFNKYKWLGLSSFIVVVGASGVVAVKTNNAPPNYVANGTLTYNGFPVPHSTDNQIQQQEQILSKDVLLSNEVIEDVAEDTRISIEQIRKNINVELPEKTQTGELKTSVIKVNYKDIDPIRAEKTVLAVVKKMEQQSLEHNTNAMQSIKKNLNGSLEGIETELKQAEKALANHDKIHNSELIAVEKDNLLKAIADNQTQQQLLHQKLSSIDAQSTGLSYSQAFIASTFSTDPSVVKLIEQINQTELKLAEYQSIFLPAHPSVIKLEEQLIFDNVRLQRRAAEAVTALRQQLNGLKQSEEKLQQQRAIVTDKQQKRSPFEQQVQRQKAIYEPLVAKLKEVEMLEKLTVSSWVAQEQASIALEKGLLSKSVPLILSIGAFLGVLVGSCLIVLLGALESKFQTWEEISESLQERQMQLLGILPLLKVEAGNQTLPIVSLYSPYVELYERCWINLRSFRGRALKVVLLASTVHFEGKTVSAYNLGVISARAGKKTLIVEADLRSPSQSQFLGVTPPEVGVEPLRYYGNPNHCILPVPTIENLYIVPSPGPMQQTAAVLESQEIQLLLEFARSSFDLVILDTPALGYSNDALLLEPYSDGIVLVTRPDYTEKKLLAEAITQLTELELRLLGVIINGVDLPAPYFEIAEYKEIPSSKAKSKNEEVSAETRYL